MVGDVTGAQIKAARILLDWNLDEISSRSGLPAYLIDGVERGTGTPEPQQMEALRQALETAGIVFTGEPGSGVALKRKDEGLRPDELNSANDV